MENVSVKEECFENIKRYMFILQWNYTWYIYDQTVTLHHLSHWKNDNVIYKILKKKQRISLNMMLKCQTYAEYVKIYFSIIK